MPVTLVCARQPADPTRRGDLEKLFGSPAFLFFKEMVVSRCVESQVEAMNAALYQANDIASEKLKASCNKAVELNLILDLLDDLSKNEQEWFTVKVETVNH
jgi:hypothetical protein